ncbi:hypothetical protein LXL04_030584 [Taraxacum kok-saghyz]
MIKNTYNDDQGDHVIKRKKLSNPNTISRQYSGFHNPRIVRVSRNQGFGGKDRHSKVWTVKGVRDRRIRLSMPTAIQLYHLQDQLGLTQPSKVIDWLLDVTKDDIEKLPPLQMVPEDFTRFHLPPSNVPHSFSSSQLSFSPFRNNMTPNDLNYYHQRMEGKEVIGENKWNSYNNNYQDFNQPFSNLSLSRFDQKLDGYTSLFPSSSGHSTFELPQIFPRFSGTPSFFPPYVMPLQLLSSSSQCLVPINLVDSQVKVPFGLNMNSVVSSQSNGNGKSLPRLLFIFFVHEHRVKDKNPTRRSSQPDLQPVFPSPVTTFFSGAEHQHPVSNSYTGNCFLSGCLFPVLSGELYHLRRSTPSPARATPVQT